MHHHKKLKLDSLNEPEVLFNSWCQSNGIIINNAVILRSLDCSGNGLFATEDFEIGDVIFSIPKSNLYTQSSSNISTIIQKECKDVTNNWVPVLIGIIYEYCLKKKSKWFPYFNLTMNFDELDLPIFWSRKEVDRLLIGTGIHQSVVNDLKGIEKDFIEIVKPFIDKYSSKFENVKVDLYFYKKIVSFVMAYSFTLPDDECHCPILVPLADILNHVTDNNSKLVFGDTSLSMVAVKNIMKGEEIFNTYGNLSNSSLLHMYGFAEHLSDGKYDSVELPLSILFESSATKSKQIEKFYGDEVIVLLQHGIADKDFVDKFLRKFVGSTLNDNNNEETSDDDSSDAESYNSDENDDNILTLDQISSMDSEFKAILLRLIEHAFKQYPNSLAQEENILNCYKGTNAQSPSSSARGSVNHESLLSKRQYYAACVRKGQLCLLNKFKLLLS